MKCLQENKQFIPDKISRIKTKTFIERSKDNLSDPDKKKRHHISIERRSESKESRKCILSFSSIFRLFNSRKEPKL